MKTKKQLLSILLSLVMVLSLMPGMSLTVYAATETYTNLMNDKTVVKFNNYDWYIIADNSTAVDAGTVTLLAADTSFGTSKFHDSSSAYSGSTVKGVLDALTAEGGAFASVKDAIADTDLSDVSVTGAKLYLLSTSEAGQYANFNFTGAQYGNWWLRSPGDAGDTAAIVSGEYGSVYGDGVDVNQEFGVRPALKLDLSKVTFDSESKTFSVSAASIPPVNYKAANVEETTHAVTFTDANCEEYIVVDASTTTFEDGKWYVVNTPSEDNLTISDRITVSGTANLILCDGAALTASKGIATTGAALNIYGQTNGTGALTANAPDDSAGIGGNISNAGGELTINGGTITANGGNFGAGIGGGFKGAGGTVIINGGTVTANGGNNGAGIGGGCNGSGVSVTINGGMVRANGGDDAKGIGEGSDGGEAEVSNGSLTLGDGVNLYTSTDKSNWSAYNDSRSRYMRTAETYTITWKLDWITTLDTTQVKEGEMPTHADPVKSDLLYIYTFRSWYPAIEAATKNTSYRAQFDQTTIFHDVGDSIDFGDSAYVRGTASGSQNIEISGSYTIDSAVFNGEKNCYDLVLRSGDNTIELTASGREYENFAVRLYNGNGSSNSPYRFSIVQKGKVIWKDENGNILEVDEDVPDGSRPSFDGEYSKESDSPEDYYYVSRWYSEYNGNISNEPYALSNISNVYFDDNGQKIYHGKLIKVKYLKPDVVFYKNDGIDAGDSYFKPENYAIRRGAIQILTALKLYSSNTANNIYRYQVGLGDNGSTGFFYKIYDESLGDKVAWKCTGGSGTQDDPYTFEFIPRADITWKLDEDTVIETTPYLMGETPTHADVTKAADDTYIYTFKGWTPEIVPVTEDATYTAVFDKAERFTAVETLFNALPARNNVTAADEPAIKEARAAYDALTDEQKQKIDPETLAKLNEAEGGIADAEAAAAVDEMIDNIGRIELTDECRDQLVRVRNAYQGLTDDQKARVTNEKTLEYSEALYATLVAQQAAELAKAKAEAEAQAAKAEAEAAQQAAEAAQANAEAEAQAAKEAKESADEATAAAQAAKAEAEAAQQAAEEAQANAEAEAQAAKEAKEAAEAAKESADEATAAAQAAKAEAEAAQQAAEAAQANAEAEAQAAKEAKEAAEEAKESADEATAAAQAAQQAAEEARKAAEDIAKEAKESADEAIREADEKAKAAEDAQKAAEAAKKAAEDAQKAAEAAKEAVEKAIKNASDKLTAKTVTDAINALPAAADISANDKTAVENARKAYEALTDTQKALIDEATLKKLTDAEEALAALEESTDVLLGDVNNDGAVDSSDALVLLRASVGLEELSAEQMLSGDVNNDGTVDSADALEVLRYSVGQSANENIGEVVSEKTA